MCLHADSGSRIFIVTVATLLHNLKEYGGTPNGTGGRKVKVTAVSELCAMFHLSPGSIKVVIEKLYSINSSKHHSLGVTPFVKKRLRKATHRAHGSSTFILDKDKIYTPMSEVSNSIDCAKLEKTLPYDFSMGSMGSMGNEVFV